MLRRRLKPTVPAGLLAAGIMVGAMTPPMALPARAGGFLAGYEDLPLPPALHEVPEAGVTFEAAHGRIVEAYARGHAKGSDILAFYAQTLPQLGWRRESDTIYRREEETLRLEISDTGRPLVVRFVISPE